MQRNCSSLAPAQVNRPPTQWTASTPQGQYTLFHGNTQEKSCGWTGLDNKIDLHHVRAVQAQRAYQYYVERLCNEPEYRAQLEAEIKVRWRKYNKRRWKQREFGGSYKLRGSNKELARRLGRPTEYDRLAVLATSVFHLSHWRCDVTVSNYLLAY